MRRMGFVLFLLLLDGHMAHANDFRSACRPVDPHQAIQLINHEGAIIIDVREAHEFMASHMPEAENIPLTELDSRMSELEPLKEKNLLLVCASGVRTEQASSRLEKQGFAHVRCLEGGVNSWQRAGLPLRSQK